ncbi:YpmS family protein [Aquibacillus koreensis]|uniref:YpmS family protein n=2 Tax=Aquibacillus koreensis TaxID=279446 RepID=A0A9X4AIC1_9BACI|nr:YpmS family protein [Aquibacillus koreensis]MCT2538220.1 YpmS family protein [Aquibacillus koreensis]MDC3420836.1 YpmS family protein [Aquibacillus koreensis]
MMDNQGKTRFKQWKLLFLTLLGLNICVFISLLLLIFFPTSSDEIIPEKEYIEEEPGAEFTVQSSKQNLNELVNGYVDKLLKDDDGNKYSVILDEDVQLIGSIKAFNTDVPISIRLEPIVQDNGDLILKQKEISLGLLQLPNERVLSYLKKSLPTPEWVTINPKEENIYVEVTKMEMKSNFRVRVQQFNLADDKISFRIKVPNKTLGL